MALDKMLGAAIRLPELDWHAQAVPHYDYLLADAPKAMAAAIRPTLGKLIEKAKAHVELVDILMAFR